MLLSRNYSSEDGIFGTLSDESGLICHTLEHAYRIDEGYEAKVPVGEYLCRRGIHQLAKGDPFETFEVTGVPGHSGILFHWGNYNKDSSGCILVGEKRLPTMLMYSKRAFTALMFRLRGVDEFRLTVEEK